MGLGDDFDSGPDRNEFVEFDDIDVAQANTAGAGGLADEVLAICAVDVDVAVFARFVVIFLSIEPEDAGEDQIFFFHWVRGFPDTTRGFASNELGAGFGVVADLLADAVPAERGFVAVGFGTDAFLCGGDGKGAGDGAVFGKDVETLGGDRDAEMRHRV